MGKISIKAFQRLIRLHLFVDSLTGVLVDRLTSLSEPLDLLLVAFLLCLLYVLGVPDLERKELNMS